MIYVNKKQERTRSAVTLQRWWRATIGTRKRKVFTNVRKALVALQAAHRGRTTRHALTATAKEEGRRTQSAACIQAWLRGRFQRWWYLAFIWQVKAAVRIQAVARGFNARKRTEAAGRGIVLLQALARGRSGRQAALERVAALASASAATAIGAAFRGWLVRSRRKREVHSALKIQTAIRRVTAQSAAQVLWKEARERATEEFKVAREFRAASTLQAWNRCQISRSAYLSTRASVIRLQAAYRCHAAQSLFRRTRASATAIQAKWRGALAQGAMKRSLLAVTRIQALGRGIMARRTHRAAMGAAVAIEAAWRGAMVRSALRRSHLAAIRLQATGRGMIALKQYQDTLGATRTLQAAWRARALAHRVLSR
ncbi:unnamed protein product, partial [Discosporangium mesarthrocarpum]